MSKIVIKNLEKSFGNNKVINNFNIKIEDGEFIVLVDLQDVENQLY